MVVHSSKNTFGVYKRWGNQVTQISLGELCLLLSKGNSTKQLHSAAMDSPCSPVMANIYMEYFEDMALGPELPNTITGMEKVCGWCLQHYPKGQKGQTCLKYLNSIDPHIKFTVEQTKWGGGHSPS